MIKYFILIALFCLMAFSPGLKTEFVLDDYYTIVRNPLIKQPELYPDIFKTHLFSSYDSAGYIKYRYYRPILVTSYIVDYQMFKLNATAYQWINWAIHLANGLLVFILIQLVFKDALLALLTALFFVVLPSQEWVVRYITGRSDSIQTFFGLASMIFCYRSLQSKNIIGYVLSFVCLVLSILGREFGYLIPLYQLLLIYTYRQKEALTYRFGLLWMLIGSISLIFSYHLFSKQGPILSLHLFYFMSIGLCLCFAAFFKQQPWRRVLAMILVMVLSLASFSQQSYWTSEEKLLSNIHEYEKSPLTVAHQQLLMKYVEDVNSIKMLISKEKHPIVKSLWNWRLGQIAFVHQDLISAGKYFDESLMFNPNNLDSLNSRAIVYLMSNEHDKGYQLLLKAYEKNPKYVQTLNNLGIYQLTHGHPEKAAEFFRQVRYYEGI